MEARKPPWLLRVGVCRRREPFLRRGEGVLPGACASVGGWRGVGAGDVSGDLVLEGVDAAEGDFGADEVFEDDAEVLSVEVAAEAAEEVGFESDGFVLFADGGA